MTTSLYIYYRLRPGTDTRAAAARVGAMQQALAARYGVQGTLMRRADDPATWMEIYRDLEDADRFCAALDEAVSQHGLDKLLDSGARRHIERFVPLASA